ncbi:MAG: ATP-binding protein [Acidimicrobiales bacterium]
MVLVLVVSGLFVYFRLQDDLDDAINAELQARATAVAAAVTGRGPDAVSGTPLEDAEESFAQVLDLDGRLLVHAGTASDAAIDPREAAEASTGDRWVERDVANVDGTVRMFVRAVTTDDQALVLVVGQSLVDRNDALRDVRNSFAIGGPIAVLIASCIGYWLARLALRPVEDMRRTAGDISARRTGQRLPLPQAHDELRRLGETLNDMLGRLEGAFERERMFVSNASHELRTPVAVAKMELEGALRIGDFGADVGEAIKAAIEECDSLGQLAEDLLIVARTDEGGLDLLLESLPVRAVLDGVRVRFIDRAASHGRDIRVEADGDPMVLGDRARLRQALGNLVDNALRHGSGTITLRGLAVGADAVIEVSDQGPGFPAAMVERAFDRFARGDHTRTRAGAGLGLAIVQALAEAHGGQAEIIGTSTVRISLPIASR